MSAQPCGCDPEENDHKCLFHSGTLKQSVPTSIGGLDSTMPIRTFDSGATRNTDTDKYDYEGFLNPEALHAFGEYMHAHRKQKNGAIRDADNWQKGMPFRLYVKSLVRHAIDLWRMERGYEVINPDTNEPHTKRELCCAIVFNAMGYLKEVVDPSPINQVKANSPKVMR